MDSCLWKHICAVLCYVTHFSASYRVSTASTLTHLNSPVTTVAGWMTWKLLMHVNSHRNISVDFQLASSSFTLSGILCMGNSSADGGEPHSLHSVHVLNMAAVLPVCTQQRHGWINSKYRRTWSCKIWEYAGGMPDGWTHTYTHAHTRAHTHTTPCSF